MHLRVVPRLLVHVAASAVVASPVHAQTAAGTEVVVNVVGMASTSGQIGCALFRPGPAFPMDGTGTRQLWMSADAGAVTCRFADVPDGEWAVSVSHDLNGNRKVDTNFLGMPREAWSVSNNVRPTMRPPRFEEAAFKVTSGKPVTLEVRVGK